MESVANAVRGAALGSISDASSSRPNTTEASVMERIIITVPPTIGVTILLRMNSHLEMTIWITAETSIRVVSVAGPPSTTAALPLVRGLMEMSMSFGAALTLMISSAAVSLYAAAAVVSIVRPRIFVLYVLLALSGACLADYLANWPL